jgi:plasmid stabilization system protein ParE
VSHSIHPDAEAELGDAAAYYATHANGMIALAFLAEYERVRDLLVENQQLGPHGEDGLRVYHFDRFPYTVVYEENDANGPQIFAIAHQSREPGYWSGRT